MPAIPFIPLIAGAVGGTILGRRGSSSSPNPAQVIDPQQQSIIDIQKRLADYGIPAGQESFTKASSAYDTSLDFYKKILTGSNEDLLSLINADEYTRSADQSEAAAYSLAGRSGNRAAALAGVNESRAGDLNRILTQLRASAPGEISTIGQAIANMGAQQLSAGAGGLSSASNALFGLSQLKQQDADRRSQLIASIIGTAGGVAGAVLGGR